MVTEKVYCACHGTEVLAVIRDGQLVIRDRRHGENHTAVIQLDRPPKPVLDSEHGTDTQSQ